MHMGVYMKKDLYVGLGGALGTILRFIIHELTLPLGSEFRPLLTMLINISGSFLLGFLMVLFGELYPVKAEIRLGITTGVLGGYTTFSTLCKEAVLLTFSGNLFFSTMYVAFSLVLGLFAAWLGIKLAKVIERRWVS